MSCLKEARGSPATLIANSVSLEKTFFPRIAVKKLIREVSGCEVYMCCFSVLFLIFFSLQPFSPSLETARDPSAKLSPTCAVE